MTTFGLTRAMRDAMRVIQELSAENGVPPSFEELGHELGLASKSGVSRLVRSLVVRGYLAHSPFRARSLTVLVDVPPAEDFEFVGLFDAPELAAAIGQ